MVTIFIDITFALITAISFVRLFRGMSRMLNKSECTRYYSYIVLALFGAVIFTILGLANKSNLIIFLGVISLSISMYFNFCWTHLALSSTKNSDQLILVRPTAIFWLIVTCFVEALSFFLAGPDDFEHILITDANGLTKSFWLWSGATFVISYLLICELILLLKVLKGIKRQDDTRGLETKFALVTYSVFISLSLVYFLASVSSLLILRFSNWQPLLEICSIIASTGNLLFFLYLIVNNFDRKLFRLYENWYKKQTLKLLQELRPFYTRSIALFPAPYRQNAFNFVNIRSNESILRSVVNGFSDIRMQLHRGNAQHIAEKSGVPIELVEIPLKESFNQEIKLWREGLSSPDNANIIKTLVDRVPAKASISVPRVVPDEFSTRQLALYYRKLGRKLKIGELPELQPENIDENRKLNKFTEQNEELHSLVAARNIGRKIDSDLEDLNCEKTPNKL